MCCWNFYHLSYNNDNWFVFVERCTLPFILAVYFTVQASTRSELLKLVLSIYIYIKMGMLPQLFGLWPRDYCVWIGMVRKLAQIACVGTGSCQGMMGNKDIIECKLSHRGRHRERQSE